MGSGERRMIVGYERLLVTLIDNNWIVTGIIIPKEERASWRVIEGDFRYNLSGDYDGEAIAGYC